MRTTCLTPIAAAVSEGRRAEFGGFAAFKDPGMLDRIPDPNAESTFLASKMKWEERTEGEHAVLLAHIGELLAIRHRMLVPRLAGQHHGGRWRRDGEALRVEWTIGGATGDAARPATLRLLAHFGTAPIGGVAPSAGTVLYSSLVETGPAGESGSWRLQPGAVHINIEENERA